MILEDNVISPTDILNSLPKPDKVNLNNYEFRDVIGRGAFGKVSLVREISSNQFFAIKQLQKADIMRKKQIDHLKNEIYILNSINHPFIVNVKGITQNSKHIYIVLDYIPGGELFTLLRNETRLGKLEASFYASNVILALEYLHLNNVVYRDLKPENLLIDVDGYLKISDFGFAKIISNRTYTLCGTPEYVAPEVIRNVGHGKGADWWSLGVLLYEMLIGIDPFNADTPMEVFKRILRQKIQFPEKFYKDGKSLIKHLLERDLSKRYGNLSNGLLKRLFGYKNTSFL